MFLLAYNLKLSGNKSNYKLEHFIFILKKKPCSDEQGLEV
jgi:hypothetical protein